MLFRESLFKHGGPPVSSPQSAHASTLLKNALIVDGTGAEAFTGDVMVSGGRIEQVGTVGSADAQSVIDLSGLVLAPGFIDSHTHYDAQVLWDPDLNTDQQLRDHLSTHGKLRLQRRSRKGD